MECRWTGPEVAILGADQKERSFWDENAAQSIETWQANSSTENTPIALKNFVPMATQSLQVPTHLISICK